MPCTPPYTGRTQEAAKLPVRALSPTVPARSGCSRRVVSTGRDGAGPARRPGTAGSNDWNCGLTAGSCCSPPRTGGGGSARAGCARTAFWGEVKRCARPRGGHCSGGERRRNTVRVKVLLGPSRSSASRGGGVTPCRRGTAGCVE